MKLVYMSANRDGGCEICFKKRQCFILVSLEVFWLPRSNRGQGGKGDYRSRQEVLSIDMGENSEVFVEAQRKALTLFSIVIEQNDKNRRYIVRWINHQ